MKSSLVSSEKRPLQISREFYVQNAEEFPKQVRQILNPHAKEGPYLWRFFGTFLSEEGFDWTPESNPSELKDLDEEIWRPITVSETIILTDEMSKQANR